MIKKSIEYNCITLENKYMFEGYRIEWELLEETFDNEIRFSICADILNIETENNLLYMDDMGYSFSNMNNLSFVLNKFVVREHEELTKNECLVIAELIRDIKSKL